MEWFRAYHGISSDAKWRLVARMSKQPVAVVLAVWVSLLDHASQADDRGSIAGVDYELLDVTLDLEDGVAKAVVGAMAVKGLVKDGRISAWDKRQVRREESDTPQAKTVAQRVAEHRARKRAATQEQQGVTQCNAQVTQCNAQVTQSHTASCSETNCNAPDTDTDTDTERDSDLGESINCAAGAAPHAQKQPAGRRPKSILSGKRLESFEQFWSAYGYKRGRGGAEKAWAAIPQLTDSFVQQICAAARKEAERRPSLEARGQTPKMAQGWLNERRWEDDYTEQPAQAHRPYVPQGRQGERLEGNSLTASNLETVGRGMRLFMQSEGFSPEEINETVGCSGETVELSGSREQVTVQVKE